MMRDKNLTPKQGAVFSFLQKRVLEEGRPPTIREIGKRFGFRSTGTSRDYLAALAKKGYLKRLPRSARAIQLLEPPDQKIPLLGRITAGEPNLASEFAEGHVDLGQFLPREGRPIFALRVKGDSMTGKGISDGDIAIIRKQERAEDGDIVAGLIDQEATIKILKTEKARFYLAPANDAYPAIRRPFVILGRVIAVIKRF